jgi:hypothetical protein
MRVGKGLLYGGVHAGVQRIDDAGIDETIATISWDKEG